MLEFEKDEKVVYNQTCSNKYCNTQIVFDGEQQENLQYSGNDIVIKQISIIKINKVTKQIRAKCKKCKRWNVLLIKFK